MNRVLATLAFFLVTGAAMADGNGCDIIPFSSIGGVVTGTIAVYPDGSAALSGQIRGIPFAGLGKAARNPDGSWDFPVILSDTDVIIKTGGWVPLKLHFIGTPEDATDGDDTDDPGGAIDVKNQQGAGRGSIQLGC